jgi:ATP-dependent HslUV protease ATP-binding subunit HslU
MLTPKQIVDELGRYIVGQDEAKRAVAVALRNRYRRSRLPREVQEEITPKNIIMMGPTGVGKTEIARRLAKLVEAPFVKVEATKFTEVGYVGRDVESMVRDLMEASVRLVKEKKMKEVEAQAAANAEERLVRILVPGKHKEKKATPFDFLMGREDEEQPKLEDKESSEIQQRRQGVRQALRAGTLDNSTLEMEVEENGPTLELMPGMGEGVNLQDMFGGMLPKKKKKRKMKLKEARQYLEQEEAQKLIDMDEVTEIAREKAENEGILFIDEIDKIAGRNGSSGPDVSREGVQRDILPIVEGSTVVTKYGPVKTDYILFIAAGAFHVSKVSDLIPELQGRFPITVTLENLTAEDFKRILTQPENAVTKQYEQLLATDNVKLTFTEDAIEAIAENAFWMNENSENIGARRLHTVVELLLEDISFNATGDHPLVEVVVDKKYVEDHMASVMSEQDVSRYIL